MSSINNNGRTLFQDIRALFHSVSKKRKIQLLGLLALQLLSAFSEVLSLGAIVPFLGALTDASSILNSSKISWVLEYLGISDAGTLIVFCAFAFAGAIVIANIIRFITLYVQMHLGASIGVDIGADLFRKTLSHPYLYFTRNNSSEIIGNMVNDFNATMGVLQGTLTIITHSIITLFIISGLFIYDASVAAIILLATVAAYSFVMIIVRNRLHRNSLAMSDSYRSIVRVLQEGVGGIRYIVLEGGRESFVERYKKSSSLFRHSAADNNIIRQFPRYFIESFGVIVISVLAIVIFQKTDDLGKVVPLLGFYAMAAHRLLPAGQQIYSSISSIMGLRTSLVRTLEVLEKEFPLLSSSIGEPLSFKTNLAFNNVWFDYGRAGGKQAEWTIKEVSFSIKPKTTVAIVGHTGSGKSTVADLILGLISPNRGTIEIDGKILDSELTRRWQAGIAHVPQNIFLTDASIAENIAFGLRHDEIDMERVVEVSRYAKIDGFIETLPDKYHEIVGERGARLSGGQLQRIGIARALYRNPSLVVFDEATSALDSSTEKGVMDAIYGLGRELTVILIAHRISTVKKADMIFVFDDGRLVARGSYDELLKESEYFKDLVIDG